MTTGWGEARTGAEQQDAVGAFAPARAETANDAGIAFEAVATFPAPRGLESLCSEPPEWPEKAIYIYL